MLLKSIGSFINKRDMTTLGVFACLFAALLLFHMNVWRIIAVLALLIGYVSWADTKFLVTQHTFNWRNITAWVLPCLGLVWLVAWSARRLFGL